MYMLMAFTGEYTVRLNHANLAVTDVAALREFFVRHFAFAELGTRGKGAFTVLQGADGFVLSLMRCRSAPPADFQRAFHVGFLVDAPETVRAKHAELATAGRAPGEVEQVARGGLSSTTFYCQAPGGVLVEVSAHA